MKKVIIIGAGPAGLTAAYELLKQSKEYNVTVLEATDRIGGISQTVRYNGNRMDIGGHRFFSKNEKVMNWWKSVLPMQGAPAYDDKKLGIEKKLEPNGPDPEKDDEVMLLRNRVSRIYYNNAFFDYPISLKASTIHNMGFGQSIVAGFSYLKSCVHKLPEDSLENFYINRFGRKLYSIFFEGYTEKLWGRSPKYISADWGAQRVKGLSIMGVLKDSFSKIFHTKKDNTKVETSLIEEFMYPKYGPGELWETVAKHIEDMGGNVYMNEEVNKICFDGNKITSVKTNSKSYDADIVISSMPIVDLMNSFDVKIDKKIKDISDGLPYRDFVTVGLLVPELKIKNKTKLKTLNNTIPDCWIYVQDTKVKLGRIQVFNNWSPYMVKDVEHTMWIGLEYFCAEHDDFWNLSDQDCVDLAIKELVSMGIIESKDSVIDSHRERIKKAYPAYFDTYKDIDQVITYLNSIENLYCVGRNGQHRYNNMDHSMVTSFETVKDILSGTNDKSNIWEVNTEKEYHEEK